MIFFNEDWVGMFLFPREASLIWFHPFDAVGFRPALAKVQIIP